MNISRFAQFLIILLLNAPVLLSQVPASSSVWLYPDGNLSATKYNAVSSTTAQVVDSFKIKWFSPDIKGDVQPLIGNIVSNSPIIENSPIFPYAPNEIAAVIGDTLVILCGSGKLLDKFCTYDTSDKRNVVIGISALLDTASAVNAISNPSRTLILGFESIEAERPDSLAVTYLGGWDHSEDKFKYTRRLALNLLSDPIRYWDDYQPNFSASIKPVYARKKYFPDYSNPSPGETAGFLVFATVNMEHPVAVPN